MRIGRKQTVQRSTLLKDVAKEVQESFSHEILLATVDGKLQELIKKSKKVQVWNFSQQLISLVSRPIAEVYC